MTATRPFDGNERKLKDRAHVLMRKGKFEAAADVYLALIAGNNKDPSLRLHHAELCDKLNRKDRAVASYQVAAHLLVTAGHTARARAALNSGLRISPQDSGLRRALRELSPPPKLALVPRPISYVDFDLVPDDEALTEPYMVVMEEWTEVVLSNSGCSGLNNRTVSQRAPSRVPAAVAQLRR